MALIDAKYVLELWFAGKLTRAYVLPYVQSYVTSDRASATFRHTLGSSPARYHSGYRNIPIAVTGVSGQGFRLGQTRSGAPRFADGPALFEELRKFLREYESICQSSQGYSLDGRPYAELIFRAVAEGDAWKLEDVNLAPARDAGATRFSWAYTLTGTGYAQAQNMPALDGFDAFLGNAQAYAQAATEVVDSASGYVALMTQRVKGVRAGLGAFLGPVQAVSRLMGQVSALARAARSVGALPADYARASIRVAVDGIQALNEAAQTLPLGERLASDTRQFFFDAASAMGTIERAAALALGLRFVSMQSLFVETATQDPTTALGALTAPLAAGTGAPSQPVTQYTVQQGDTLQSIAQGLASDGSAVASIMALNGMIDAGTLSDGSPLRPGAVLLVPNVAGAKVGISGGVSQSPDPYGTDLLLDSQGDLVLSGTDPIDLSTVTGMPNYLQAIGARCRTVQGEHRVFQSYGIPVGPGDELLASTVSLVAAHLRQQLTMDPRTAEILDLVVEDRGDTIYATAALSSTLGQVQTVSVPVEAA